MEIVTMNNGLGFNAEETSKENLGNTGKPESRRYWWGLSPPSFFFKIE